MSGAALTLGPVSFSSYEVPEKISFGGTQELAVHRFVGGAKQVDAMGRDDLALAWSGRFQGSDALSRARQLDALRVAGQPLALTWDELSYTVVIRRFVADFEKAWQLPYSIECEVVSDNGTAPVVGQGPSIDDQMTSDVGSATDYGDEVGDDTLTSNLSTLSTAMGSVPTFIGATQAILATVAGPLAVCQGRVAVLINANEAVLSGAPVVGGLALGAPIAQNVGAMNSQVAAMQALANLYPLDATLARMAKNLTADGVSGTPVPVAGADLTQMAVQTYGDAAQWPLIAQANGRTDPIVTDVTTIRVPAPGPSVDGVLQP